MYYLILFLVFKFIRVTKAERCSLTGTPLLAKLANVTRERVKRVCVRDVVIKPYPNPSSPSEIIKGLDIHTNLEGSFRL